MGIHHSPHTRPIPTAALDLGRDVAMSAALHQLSQTSKTAMSLHRSGDYCVGTKRQLYATTLTASFQVYRHVDIKMIPVVRCIGSTRRPAPLCGRYANLLNPEASVTPAPLHTANYVQI